MVDGLGKAASLGRWKVLWRTAWFMLVAGGCEFDIKPRHIHSFVKRLLGSSYEPSTGFSAWEI